MCYNSFSFIIAVEYVYFFEIIIFTGHVEMEKRVTRNKIDKLVKKIYFFLNFFVFKLKFNFQIFVYIYIYIYRNIYCR